MTDTRSNIVVLVVEDTLEYAQLNLLTLKRIGLTGIHAKDGLEAVQMIDERKPDLVLLDLNLPGMSGWQVLEHLGKRYEGSNTPVVVTSAYGDSANRLVRKLQDVYCYLIKPFQPRDLMVAVENALGLQRSV